MIKKIAGEVWKTMESISKKKPYQNYAVSSHGRVASFKENVLEDGKLLTGSLTSGYRTLNRYQRGSYAVTYVHREVARLFCKKPSAKHTYVIHINHNKKDNKASNLKWCTVTETFSHAQKSPDKIAYKKRQANMTEGRKLDVAKVKKLRAEINDPKRKVSLKKLAEKYKISEMSLYRVRRGDNWGHVK